MSGKLFSLDGFYSDQKDSDLNQIFVTTYLLWLNEVTAQQLNNVLVFTFLF